MRRVFCPSLLMIALILLIFASCRPQPGTATGSSQAATKVLTGLEAVVAIPSAQSGDRVVVCGNTAIPALAPTAGQQNPRMMPFWRVPGVPVKGLYTGDKVRFDVKVDWSVEHPLQITSLQKLKGSSLPSKIDSCQGTASMSKKK